MDKELNYKQWERIFSSTLLIQLENAEISEANVINKRMMKALVHSQALFTFKDI